MKQLKPNYPVFARGKNIYTTRATSNGQNLYFRFPAKMVEVGARYNITVTMHGYTLKKDPTGAFPCVAENAKSANSGGRYGRFLIPAGTGFKAGEQYKVSESRGKLTIEHV